MDAIKVMVERTQGYSGKSAAFAKGYVAQITGTDQTYGLAREFRRGEDDGSRDRYRKPKARWTVTYYLDEPGLYEVSEGGERRYMLVFRHQTEARWTWVRCPLDRAQRIARMMDDGEEYESARLSTRPAAV